MLPAMGQKPIGCDVYLGHGAIKLPVRNDICLSLSWLFFLLGGHQSDVNLIPSIETVS